MKKEIERIVREFIPHKNAEYIPDLVKALEVFMTGAGNTAFNEGCSFGSDSVGREI